MSDKDNPNIVITVAAIAGGAVAGHLVGQLIRPQARRLLKVETPAQRVQAAVGAEEGFHLGLTRREVMPGVALALLVRGSVGGDLRAVGGAAFLGAAALTVLAGTKYDEQARGALKRFAPMGQFLA